jgi:DUF971 family protein
MPGPDAPTEVEVDRVAGVELTWADGTQTRYELEELRANCPCAECRGRRERGLPVWPQPSSPLPLRIENAELVGAWGLSFRWNDGHSTGIYSWEVLRAWRADVPDGTVPTEAEHFEPGPSPPVS